MAENELGKLSPEQVQKLANTISEAKNLTNQQEEIIKQVLKGETEIGNLRISSLEKYFDIYSRNLDLVARKHSALNDTFLILDKKLNENYQKISSDLTKLERRLENISGEESESSEARDAKKETSSKQAVTDKNPIAGLDELVNSAINALTKSYKADYANKLKIANDGNTKLAELERQYQEHRFNQLTQQLSSFMSSLHEPAIKSAFIPSGQADKQNTDVQTAEVASSEQQIAFAAPKGPADDSVNVFSTLTESLLNLLTPIEVTTADITALFNEVAASEKAHAKVLKDIQAGKIQDENEAWNKYLNNLDAARESFGSQLIRQEKELNQKIIALAIEKNLTEDDILRRSVEFRLSKLQEAADAELSVKKFANKTRAQLDYTSTKKGQEEAGRLRATAINTTEELKSRKELEEQISRFRERLEAKARAEHNGKLLKKDAATIEELVNAEYNKRLKKLNQLTKERLAKEQLLAEAGLNEAFEKKRAERKRALELEALRRNNGIITKEERASIDATLDKEFAIRSARSKALLKELGETQLVDAELAALKENDAGFAAEVDAKIKKEIADQEYQYRLAHNNELNKQAIKDIEYQAKLKYTRDREAIDELKREYLEGIKIGQLKKDDPALAAERSARVAKRVAELELQYREANNNQLNEQALEAIKKQAEAELAYGSDNVGKLAEEYTEKMRQARLKENDPVLYEAFDRKRAERKRQLELEALQRNNGIITEAARKNINETLNNEFDTRSLQGEALLKDLGQNQLVNSVLADVKENDPSLSAKLEARLQKEIADEEYKYRKTHNNELDKQAKEQIELQAKQRLVSELDARKKIAAEELAIDRLKYVDQSLTQKREAEIAKYKADLEYKFMLENDGKLTEKAVNNIQELADQKFAAESEAMERLAKLRLQEETYNRFKEANQEAAAVLEKRKAKELLAEEIKLRKKYNGEELANRLKQLKDEKKLEQQLNEKNQKQLEKIQLRADKEKRKKANNEVRQEITGAVTGQLTKEHSLADRFKELSQATRDKVTGDGDSAAMKALAGIDTAISAISDLAAQLDSTIDKIASYQGDIDTRLQGSSNKQSRGSYWGQLTKDMMSVGAVTPYFKQEDFANNIKSLVEKGISFDLKQRAFLMTIQEKIANTFNVADGTLLRLIRIQQEDSTAGRLGMESALNSFLNEMYETTEYLTDVAASVRGSLEEMEALMGGAAATEVEYQVQKWMGSLYSVGMSQSAVTTISNALGQIAAGQVDALTNGGAGNLLVMAANDAGIPIADILAKGLDAKDTNKLLQATVDYLAEIAESSKDNNVVQQQLAGVFGVKASDLKAATNLASSNTTNDVYKEYLTYSNMLNQLYTMAGSMNKRTSIGEMMSNVWENGQYTLASSMANSPVAYLTYKMASLLEAGTGGIALPFVSAFGTGVDLNTTVADLMRVASLSAGILGSLGPMVSGLASSFSGQSMLSKMGIDKGSGLKITPRGGSGGSSGGGYGGSSGGVSGGGLGGNAVGGIKTTSSSGYIGNASGSDVKNATIQEAEDTKKKHIIEAKEEEANAPVNIINMNVLKIYELLDDVVHGRSCFHVKMEGYGLTKSNKVSSFNNSQGGVAGLANNSAGTSDGNTLAGGFGATSGGYSGGSGSGGPSGSSSGSGMPSGSGGGSGGTAGSGGVGGSGFGVSSSVDLGGWSVT